MGTWEDAQAQVAVKYDPQQNAVDRALAAAKARYGANQAGITTYGTSARQGVNESYDTLGGLLGANRTNSQNQIGAQVENIGRGYQQARDFNTAADQEGRDYLSRLGQSLGQNDAYAASRVGLDRTLNTILGQYNQDQAANQGNLQAWGTQWDQILGQGQNIGEQSRAKGLTDVELAIGKLLSEANLENSQTEGDLYGKLNDIMGQRQNDLVATYNQLVQQEWERRMEQAKLDAQAQQAAADLAYKYAALSSSENEGAANRAASAAAKGNGGPSMLDLMEFALKEQAEKRLQGNSDRDYQLELSKFNQPDDPTATILAGLDKLRDPTTGVVPIGAGRQLLGDYEAIIPGENNVPSLLWDRFPQDAAETVSKSGKVLPPSSRWPSETGWQDTQFGSANETRQNPVTGQMQWRYNPVK